MGEARDEETDGTEVYAFSYTHAPFVYEGVTLQPVKTPDATLVLRQDGTRVYIHGVLTYRGGYDSLESPRLLYQLPLKPGDTWTLPTGDLVPTRVEMEVEGVEAVATPLGEHQAVVLAVYTVPASGQDKEKELLRREWWAPGHGLVRFTEFQDGRMSVRTADVKRQGVPEPFQAIGHVAPDKPVLLVDEDQQVVQVVELRGRELWRLDGPYWRARYEWVHEPQSGVDLLLQSSFPGSWAEVWTYSAWSYSPDQDTLVRLDWVSSAGRQGSVAGQGQWVDGAFVLLDTLGYPTRRYRYSFNGQELFADPQHDQRIPADTARNLLERLVGVPPIGKDDFIGAFANPTLGRRAWREVQKLGWSPPGVVTGGPDTFAIEMVQARFRVRVERREGEYKIVDFSVGR